MPPSPAPFPLRPKRGLRAPFGFPLGTSARPFGRRNRRAFAPSANSVGDVRMDKPLPIGVSNGGPVGPPWSFRKRGESRGEENPLERVFLPSGVLLPSFPTREKKVGPQAETPAPAAPAGAELRYQAAYLYICQAVVIYESSFKLSRAYSQH